MGRKAKRLVSASSTNERYGETWKIEGGLDVSVPGGTREASFPLGRRMAVASRGHQPPPAVAARNGAHHLKVLGQPLTAPSREAQGSLPAFTSLTQSHGIGTPPI